MKKRKIANEERVNIAYMPDVVAELDLEIALKRRLAETLESRITWALTLQEALQTESTAVTASNAFKNAAFDALRTIETPLHALFEREIPAPPNAELHQARPPPKPKQVFNRNNKANFLYIKSASLGYVPEDGGSHVQIYLLKCPACSRTTFSSLQGLLNHARISHSLEWGTHDECVRACAVLDSSIDLDLGIEVGLGPGGVLPGLRSIFQQAVGVQPPAGVQHPIRRNEDSASLPESNERNGNLISRTLGVHKDSPALAPFLGKEVRHRGIQVWNEDQNVDIESDNSPRQPSIGKFKRTWRMHFTQRNVVQSSGGLEGTITPAIPGPSNENPQILTSTLTKQASLEGVLMDNVHEKLTVNARRSKSPLPESATDARLPSAGSRFHFMARVIVADRSFSVPEPRLEGDSAHTHMWMVSVEAPSYSHHITSILDHIKFTCPSDPSAAICSRPITKEPPFVVVGTAERPFLARIELFFNGIRDDGKEDGEMQRVIVEHWVDLDPLKSCNIVLGEEQVMDVELDKRTIIKPVRSGYVPVVSKTLWDLASSTWKSTPLKNRQGQADMGSQPAVDRQNKLKLETQPASVPNYDKLLTELLPKFPLTFQDVKGSRARRPSVPYKIVPSLSQFKSLVFGRRKAIEWGRAKALRDAYADTIENRSLSEGAIPLTTADVYHWLVEKGHLPRAEPQFTPSVKQEPVEVKKEPSFAVSASQPVEDWCPICGLGLSMHLAARAVKQEIADSQELAIVKNKTGDVKATATARRCNIVPRELQILKLPMMNVPRVLETHTATGTISECATSAEDMQPKDLIVTVDPHLTLSIRDIVGALKLPTFESLSQSGLSLTEDGREIEYPVDEVGASRSEAEAHLAPHALLALLTKCFLHALVESGIEVAKRDKIIGAGFNQPATRRGERRKTSGAPLSVLTPAHILSGVLSRGQGRTRRKEEVDKAVLCCLSRLGIPAEAAERSSGTNRSGAPEEEHVPRVKLEQ